MVQGQDVVEALIVYGEKVKIGPVIQIVVFDCQLQIFNHLNLPAFSVLNTQQTKSLVEIALRHLFPHICISTATFILQFTLKHRDEFVDGLKCTVKFLLLEHPPAVDEEQLEGNFFLGLFHKITIIYTNADISSRPLSFLLLLYVFHSFVDLVQIGPDSCNRLRPLFEMRVGIVYKSVGKIVYIAQHQVGLVQLLET